MRKKSNLMPLLLMAAGSLLILGSIAFLVAPGVFRQQATPTAALAVDSLEGVPRVSLDDALAAHQSGSAVFLDVRDAQAYESRRIAGAISMPIEQIPDRITELDPQAWIIPY